MHIMELLQIVGENEGRLKTRLRQLVEVESPSEDKPAVDRATALVASVVAWWASHH